MAIIILDYYSQEGGKKKKEYNCFFMQTVQEGLP